MYKGTVVAFSSPAKAAVAAPPCHCRHRPSSATFTILPQSYLDELAAGCVTTFNYLQWEIPARWSGRLCSFG